MINPKDIGLIIGGGMGAGVSRWELARAISKSGGTPNVSGTAISEIIARELQEGDKDGNIRRALSEFPDQRIASEILDRYFIDGGKKENDPYIQTPFPTFEVIGEGEIKLRSRKLEELLVAANFVEVKLAQEGNNRPVGINHLHKITWPLLPSFHGAMLAGVDMLSMGAGLYNDIQSSLYKLSKNEQAGIRIEVEDTNQEFRINYDPTIIDSKGIEMEKPFLMGIAQNHLSVRGIPYADGYVCEGQTAGGHNAPIRAEKFHEIDYKKLQRRLKKDEGEDKPFYLAGGYAARLGEALELGASGIQVGSIFALCEESGMDPELRMRTLEAYVNGVEVSTDVNASPSGFPFKILRLDGTVGMEEIYAQRERRCDLGYLVRPYLDNGEIKTRCPAENAQNYLSKGGNVEDIINALCLCNGLCATTGMGSDGEPSLVTMGSERDAIIDVVNNVGMRYTAADAMDYMMSKMSA